MRFSVLACDYDNTLAKDGRVSDAVVRQLQALAEAGMRLLLVTGRTVAELHQVCPRARLFSMVVAENGAVLFDPATAKERLLCEPVPPQFITSLRLAAVEPLVTGKVLCSTAAACREKVEAMIAQSGLELQIIHNKASLMVLPVGVNKATGLQRALLELRAGPEATIGIGDAENDLEFLHMCGVSVAVSNAIPALKERSTIVLEGSHGDNGVIGFLEELVRENVTVAGRALSLVHRPAN